MKKCLLSLLLITVSGVGPLWAQVPPQAEPNAAVQQARKQRIEAMEVEYIVQRLNLTKTESEHFVPLFYQYKNDVQGVRANAALDALTREEAVLNVKKRYQDQFTTVIGRNRSTYVFQSEQDFNKMLIRHLNHTAPPRPYHPPARLLIPHK